MENAEFCVWCWRVVVFFSLSLLRILRIASERGKCLLVRNETLFPPRLSTSARRIFFLSRFICHKIVVYNVHNVFFIYWYEGVRSWCVKRVDWLLDFRGFVRWSWHVHWIDRLIDWLIDWLVDDWLIDWWVVYSYCDEALSYWKSEEDRKRWAVGKRWMAHGNSLFIALCMVLCGEGVCFYVNFLLKLWSWSTLRVKSDVLEYD